LGAAETYSLACRGDPPRHIISFFEKIETFSLIVGVLWLENIVPYISARFGASLAEQNEKER
jgi:hypothetical protein